MQVDGSNKTGLVLEGGAMRGMFTCGVLDVFMENGLDNFAAVAAVSAGAMFGCNLKSRQPWRAIRYNKTFAHDKRYCSLRSLIISGNLFNADFCYRELPQKLDPFDYKAFSENPMKFFVTATDIHSGKAVYHELASCDGAEMDWMRASASMPLVSRPVEVQGADAKLELLDGGISDSIPLKFLEGKGYSKNVVILTQPKGFVKRPNKSLPLMKVLLHKYPNLLKAMALRHCMYNEETAYCFAQEQSGRALVICPQEPLCISRTERNPDELQRVYELGRGEGRRRLAEVAAYLE